MGIQPKVWGPAAWFFFHSVMHNYPEEPCEDDYIRYHNFLITFADILPCEECRRDFSQLVYEYMQDSTFFESRENMIILGYHLHDKVNEKIGNKYDISEEKLIEKYSEYEVEGCVPYEMEYEIVKSNKSMLENYKYLIVGSACIIIFLIITRR